MGKPKLTMLFLIILLTSLYPLSELHVNATSSSSSTDDWPMFHHDTAHTGATTSSAPTSAPSVIWSLGQQELQGQGFNFGSAVIVNGVLYISGGSSLWALNASIGDTLWKVREIGSSYIVVQNGVAYTSTYGAAYNATSGAQLWNTTDSITAVLAVANGYFYSLNKEGFLVGRNSSTGAVIWDSVISPSYSSPAVAYGNLYFGIGSGLKALNAYSGTIVWQYDKAGTVICSPAVSSGRVYFGSLDNKFYCNNALTGEIVWNYTMAGKITSSPAVADGYVYVGSLDGNVYAFNASTGEKIWSYYTNPPVFRDWPLGVRSSPAIAAGTVYVCSDDGNLYALNAYTGKKLWNYTLQSPFDKFGNPQELSASPAIANGRIYIGSSDRFVVLETNTNTTTPTISPTVSPASEHADEMLIVTLLLIVIVATVAVIAFRKKLSAKWPS